MILFIFEKALKTQGQILALVPGCLPIATVSWLLGRKLEYERKRHHAKF